MSAMPGRRRGHPVLAAGYQSKSIQAHGTLTMQSAFRLTMIAMFICMSGGAFAQIFECIDAGGKLEFAQKCAPGTVKQREVAKKGAGNLDSAAPPQTSYQQEEQAFRRRQMDREAQDARATAETANAEKRCQNARVRLASVETARRIYSGIDPKTGERRYLDDDERSATIQKARDAVAANCR